MLSVSGTTYAMQTGQDNSCSYCGQQPEWSLQANIKFMILWLKDEWRQTIIDTYLEALVVS